MTSVRWYEAVMGRLGDAERDAYWAEGKFFAGELGVPKDLFPATYADLERYEAEMLTTEVIPDATAISVAEEVIHPIRSLPKGVYWPNDAITAGLLPVQLRSAFGLSFGLAERRFQRAAISLIRTTRPALPRWITVVPHARRYEEAQRRK